MSDRDEIRYRNWRRRRVNNLVGVTIDLGCAGILACAVGSFVFLVGYAAIGVWDMLF